MIIPTGYDPETFYKLLVPLARRVLLRVGLPTGLYEPEDLIHEAWLTIKWKNVGVDDSKWVGYWYAILRYTALKMVKKLNTEGWRQVVPVGDEEGEKRGSLLEELSDDSGKTSGQIWDAIEEQLSLESWAVVAEERLRLIIEEETPKLSQDPYFKMFVELAWGRGHSYNDAFRTVSEAAAKEGKQPSRGRAQFIRYADKLREAVRTRWRALNLPEPRNLPRNAKLETVSPYYLRWILHAPQKGHEQVKVGAKTPV